MRFSGSFLDESECSVPNQLSTQLGSSCTPSVQCDEPSGNDVEKRFSDHFADTELDIHPHDEKFDFESNLQTHDSLSSLNVTSCSDEAIMLESTNQTTVTSWETFENSGKEVS